MAELKIDKSKFFTMNAVEVVTLVVLILSAGAGLAELRIHHNQDQAALNDAKAASTEVAKHTEEFRLEVNRFISRQDQEAARQRQADIDCPRHRHGKGGQIFYCGQVLGQPFSPARNESDPAGSAPIAPAAVPKR